MLVCANILQQYLNKNYYSFYLTGSIAMILFGIVDVSIYRHYPLELGVFIDVCGRSREEIAHLKSLADYAELNPQGLTAF
jgi:hypothetical protein